MEGIRAALFGVAHPHSRPHLRTLQHSSLVSDIVLYDEDPAVLEQIRTAHEEKIKAAYTDLDQLLQEEDLFLGIATFRNDLNADLCVRLAEAGVHILSEKPIGLSALEIERVVAAADTAGVKLGVMYQNRYHPVSQEARRLIQEGVLGQITSCEARLVTSQVQFRNPDHWLFCKAQAGGGILSWLGCHYIDLLRYALRDEIVSITALADTLGGESIDVEDVASVSFRFKGGALGSLLAGYQLALSIKGYIGPNYDTYVGVWGTEGRLFWQPTATSTDLYVESAGQTWKAAPARTFEFNLPSLDAYGGVYGLAFVEDFILAAKGEGAVPATGADALQVARIIEAAYASNETGRRVDL